MNPEGTSTRLLSEREASAFLGPVTVRTLQDWRVRGIGPAYTKLGGRVAYEIADLDAFKAAGRVEPKTLTARQEPSMNSHAASLARAHAPTVREIADHLTVLGTGLATSLQGLSQAPTLARIAMVRAQLSGASALLDKLRDALNQEAPNDG
jgi:hypothetical protein